MATGKIKVMFPSENDGSQEGAGTIGEDVSGVEYVFLTPDDVVAGNAPLVTGNNVSFEKNGDQGISVRKC